jgi:hypothetical protein
VSQWIGKFGNCAFSWIGWSGKDDTTATQQLTSEHFSCNGAVDWSICFCCESVLQKGYSFVIAQHEFQREFGIHHNHAVPSALAIKT